MPHRIANPEEKLRYYRKAADEAEQNADRATDPDVKMAYLGIMRTWIYLADELEREMALGGHEGSIIDESDDVFVPPPVKGPAHKTR